jgi:parvulin-like peptidyl-prolyl isomerase
MHQRRFVLFSFILSCLFAISGCSKRSPVVAKIDGKAEITLNELNDFINKENRRSDDYKPTLLEAKENLNQLINNKVIVLAAYQAKMDRDSALVQAVESKKRTWMLQELYRRLNIDPFIKESDIRDFYAKMGKDVVVRSIFFDLSPQATPEQEKAARLKAIEVLKKIKDGESFSALARRFSEDRTTASNDGLLGTLSWTRPDDPIRKAAFSMKEGQVSDLIRNAQGIHILYLEEIQKKDRKPLERVREEIIRTLSDSRSNLIRKKQMEIEKKLTDKTNLRWREVQFDTLAKLLANRNIYDRNSFLSALDSLSNRQKGLVLARYCRGDYTVRDLLKHAGERLSLYSRDDFSNKDRIKNLIQRWLITDQIVDLAYQKRLDRDKRVVEQSRAMIENTITRKLIQKEFSDRAAANPDSILAFYEREKVKRYTEPEKLVIQEILVDGKEPADRLYQLAITGKDFGRLAEENTIRPTYRSKKGIFPEIEKGGGGILGEAGFSMKSGEISKPISLGEGRFSIIKILQKKDAMVKPFDSVKDKAAIDCIEETRERLRSNFLSKKKSDFGGVQIFNRVLERHFNAH